MDQKLTFSSLFLFCSQTIEVLLRILPFADDISELMVAIIPLHTVILTSALPLPP